MSANKPRKIKEVEYNEKYSSVPKEFKDRLEYICDKYNISDTQFESIIQKRQNMISNLEYYDFNIVLYEEPEGTPRPRTRIINRSNIASAAMENPQFVHVYSINAKDDRVYMERLIGSGLYQLDSLIYTPCILEANAYYKTPNSFTNSDIILAELGLIRRYKKDDWDNIGKKYSDMYNLNVWLDDSFVIEGTVKKFYSILPRVEISLRYLNTLYNKNHYNDILRRKDVERINTTITYLDRYGNIVKGDK